MAGNDSTAHCVRGIWVCRPPLHSLHMPDQNLFSNVLTVKRQQMQMAQLHDGDAGENCLAWWLALEKTQHTVSTLTTGRYTSLRSSSSRTHSTSLFSFACSAAAAFTAHFRRSPFLPFSSGQSRHEPHSQISQMAKCSPPPPPPPPRPATTQQHKATIKAAALNENENERKGKAVHTLAYMHAQQQQQQPKR